ncbi:hypothetical protein [Streptomyces sp. NPDC054854]
MATGDLFSRTEPNPFTAEIAVIGGRPSVSSDGVDETELESDAELAFAFRHAANVIAAHWYATRTDDSLILVVLYNYRHALELGLKAVIKALIASLEFEDPQQQLTAEQRAILKRAQAKHVLPLLVDDLTELVQLFKMPLQDEVRAICEKIHDLDPDGQSFRYPTVKAGIKNAPSEPARPSPIYVNVAQFVQLADEACTGLDDLLDRAHTLQQWQIGLGPQHEQDALRNQILGRTKQAEATPGC